MERGETRALVGWDGKETRSRISQASASFQLVGSLLGWQVNAPHNAVLGRGHRTPRDTHNCSP